MTRLLSFILVILAAGISPVLAAEPSSESTPPTANTGSPDTSGGVTEQTESPPQPGQRWAKWVRRICFHPQLHRQAKKWVRLPKPRPIRQHPVLATRLESSPCAIEHFCVPRS